jgi:cell division septum initiation protein DivIVA
MSENPKQIIEQIRQLLVTNIRAGPPPDELALLSQEYQDVWRARGEGSDDATLATVLDEPGQWFPKPRTPAEHAFDLETERLLRKKRWVESEQLASLARMEKLLAGDERWRHNVLKQNRKLAQQIEACRAAVEHATTSAQAKTARRRILACQKTRRANLRQLAELDRAQTKVLSATRRNAIEYLGMVKRLEARKSDRRLLRKRERASRDGLGILGTLGAVCAINDFQKMAHGIDKLAKKK